jgi:hypothetical protein
MKGWVKDRRNRALVLSALLSFGVIHLTQRLFFYGKYGRFNFDLLYPDGACYTFRALKLAGYSSAYATKAIQIAYAKYGLHSGIPSPDYLNTGCASTAGRIFYPLLSTPFVKLFGVYGMVLCQIIILLGLIILPLKTAIKRNISNIQILVAGSLFINSTIIFRWGISNLVDPLLSLMFLCGAILVEHISERKKTSIFLIIIFMLIIVLGSFTKRSFPIWILLSSFPLLKEFSISRRSVAGNKRWLALLGVSTSLVMDRLVARLYGPQNGLSAVRDLLPSPITPSPITPSPITETSQIQILNQHVASSTDHWVYIKVGVKLVVQIVRTVSVECIQLLLFDLPMTILLGIFLWEYVQTKRDTKNKSLLGLGFFSLSLLLLQGGLNGTLGVNFRFQFPAVCFIYYLLVTINLNSFKKLTGLK